VQARIPATILAAEFAAPVQGGLWPREPSIDPTRRAHLAKFHAHFRYWKSHCDCGHVQATPSATD
jgi:hypothetical protein